MHASLEKPGLFIMRLEMQPHLRNDLFGTTLTNDLAWQLVITGVVKNLKNGLGVPVPSNAGLTPAHGSYIMVTGKRKFLALAS